VKESESKEEWLLLAVHLYSLGYIAMEKEINRLPRNISSKLKKYAKRKHPSHEAAQAIF